MHLLRGHFRGGVEAQALPVVRSAVGQIAAGHRLPRAGDVGLLEEVPKALEGRHDTIADGCGGFLPLGLGGDGPLTPGRGLAPEGVEEGAPPGVLLGPGHHGGNLAGHRLQAHARHRAALPESLLQQLPDLPCLRGEGPQAREHRRALT